jgi:hypothetical protein
METVKENNMEKNVTVTVKTKRGSLVTLRGDTPEEFVNKVTEAYNAGFGLAVESFEDFVLSTSVDAVQTVVDTLGATVIQETVATQPTTFAPIPPAVAAPVATGGTAVRQCAHGVMTKREGQGPYGPYKAFMCPTPKGTPDQCKAIYLKANDPEWQTF